MPAVQAHGCKGLRAAGSHHVAADGNAEFAVGAAAGHTIFRRPSRAGALRLLRCRDDAMGVCIGDVLEGSGAERAGPGI
jgi:hypothetical protein